jgi:hypothetical protein
MANSPLLDLSYLTAQQTGAETKVNRNMNLIESFCGMIMIEDRDLTSEPGGESNGEAWIVGGTGSSDWLGHDNEIAIYYDGWYFIDPADLGKVIAFVKDEKVWIAYSDADSAWHLLQDNHTTTEEWTGEYWGTDKVYMKRVNITALPNTTSQNTAHSISTVDKFVHVSIIADDGTDQIDISGGWSDGSNNVYVTLDNTNIVINTDFDASGYSAEAWLKYTKA